MALIKELVCLFAKNLQNGHASILQKYFNGASTPDNHAFDTRNGILEISQRQKVEF